MPCGTGARLESDAGAKNACRICRLEQRIDADGAGEILFGPLRDGCEPLRLISIVCILRLLTPQSNCDC